MRKSIKEALEQHLPSLAECGGFMYLHETLTDKDGKNFPMVGVIPQNASIWENWCVLVMWKCSCCKGLRGRNRGKAGAGKNKGA